MLKLVLYERPVELQKLLQFTRKKWVIFLHGIGGDCRTFSLQIKAFQPHFNLLLPDLRGHGASTDMSPPSSGKYTFELIAEDVFSLMNSLGIERAHFVGESFGATLIRKMQELHPDRFLCVVTAGGVLRLNILIYSVFCIGKYLSPVINKYFLYKIMAYIIMPKKNHAKSRQLFLKISKTVPPCEFISWLFILSEVKFKMDKLFRKPFTSPTLLINGNEDYAFIADNIRFCKKNPQTHMHIITSCGHLSNIDKYQEFNDLAIEFLLNERV